MLDKDFPIYSKGQRISLSACQPRRQFKPSIWCYFLTEVAKELRVTVSYSYELWHRANRISIPRLDKRPWVTFRRWWRWFVAAFPLLLPTPPSSSSPPLFLLLLPSPSSLLHLLPSASPRFHNDGRMLDTFQRLSAREGDYFLPRDLELSNQELSHIVKKAEQWRGFNGERRKVKAQMQHRSVTVSPSSALLSMSFSSSIQNGWLNGLWTMRGNAAISH